MQYLDIIVEYCIAYVASETKNYIKYAVGYVKSDLKLKRQLFEEVLTVILRCLMSQNLNWIANFFDNCVFQFWKKKKLLKWPFFDNWGLFLATTWISFTKLGFRRSF